MTTQRDRCASGPGLALAPSLIQAQDDGSEANRA